MQHMVFKAVIVGYFFFSSILYGSTSDENYAKILQEISQKKSSVLNQIDAMRIGKESNILNRKLEDYWSSTEVQKSFTLYNVKVRNIVNSIELRKKYSNISSMIAQYKAIVDDSDIKNISNDFVKDAMDAIQIVQEDFIDSIYNNFSQYTNKEFMETQKEISSKFDKVMLDRFKYWPESFVSIVPQTIQSKDIDSSVTITTNAGKIALGGAAILMLSKKIKTAISRTVAKKVLGKVAAKFVPYVGWALIAYDVYGTSVARSKMEEQLRITFLDEYQKTMTPEFLWGKSRNEVKSAYGKRLSLWFDKQTILMKNLLNATVLIENPTFKEYAKKSIAQGSSLDTVAKELNELKDTFGPLASQLSIARMYQMKASLPMRAEGNFLPHMVDVFGSDMDTYFDKYGKRFFEISYTLGIDNTKKLLYGKKDILDIYQKYNEYLNIKTSENAKKGFLLALNLGFNLSHSGWNEILFEQIYAHQELVKIFLEDKIPEEKIIKILTMQDVIPLYEVLYNTNPVMARAISIEMTPLQVFSRFNDTSNIDKVVSLFNIMYSEQKSSDAIEFVNSIKTNIKLLTVYDQYGKDGVDIYKNYVKDNSGKLQKDLADKALALYEKGFSKDKLLNADYVDLAYEFMDIPGGKSILNLFYPLISQFGVIGILFVILVIALILVIIIRLLLTLKKKEKVAVVKNEPIEVDHGSKTLEYDILDDTEEKNR